MCRTTVSCAVHRLARVSPRLRLPAAVGDRDPLLARQVRASAVQPLGTRRPALRRSPARNPSWMYHGEGRALGAAERLCVALRCVRACVCVVAIARARACACLGPPPQPGQAAVRPMAATDAARPACMLPAARRAAVAVRCPLPPAEPRRSRRDRRAQRLARMSVALFSVVVVSACVLLTFYLRNTGPESAVTPLSSALRARRPGVASCACA
jgi:hypothetical protein